jgi:putative two-component system response regulator
MTATPLTSPRDIISTLVSVLHNTIMAVEPYTANHSTRVADLSIETAVGDLLGLPGDQLQGLHVAGILHDIGKINVPVTLLSKTSRLLPEELALIRLHVMHGYEILTPFSWPWPIAEVALQHHERLDGSGYPNGISGDMIHPMAKIIAVTDTVEAVSSHRPYRAARGIDTALETITAGRGILYDADVVDAVIHLITVKGYVIPPYVY